MVDVDEFPIITESSRDWLSEKEMVDYRHHRRGLIKWMLKRGKDVEGEIGYARETVRRRAYHTDKFYRWVWDREAKYTMSVTHDYAEDFIIEISYSGVSNSHKNSILSAVKMLFRWRAWLFDEDEWEYSSTFKQSVVESPSPNRLTTIERRRVREAAFEYGSIPHYNSLTPDERWMWKLHLSNRYNTPIDEIGRSDFKQAVGYKIPSIIWTAMDAGLQPRDIRRVEVFDFDSQTGMLSIPTEENDSPNQYRSLSRQTSEILQSWIIERKLYEEYANSELLWLTREGNPYQSQSLNYFLRNICDIADVQFTNRTITWSSATD